MIARRQGPELDAAVQQLNIDPSNERFMMLVDDLMRPESLPRGWIAAFDPEKRRWWYRDKDGHVQHRHPLHEYYVGAIFMDQGGYVQLKKLAAEQPPTEDEIKQMGQYFKIKEDEDKYIWQVAEMALCAPLPPSWQESVELMEGGTTPTVWFKNLDSGSKQSEHPLDNYFRELIRRRRRELLRRKKAALKALQAEVDPEEAALCVLVLLAAPMNPRCSGFRAAALVKMGGAARRGMLNLAALKAAAAAEQGKAAQTGDQATAEVAEQADAEASYGEDLEAFEPATTEALLASWQGLIGSALQLVKALQAVQWNCGCDLMGCNTNSLSSVTQTAAEKADSLREADSSQVEAVDVAQNALPEEASGKDGSNGSDGSTAGSADPTRGRLQEMHATLMAALDPSSTPLDTSTAVLAELEALAAKATAAGWGYSQDERDSEIAELKKRLVEEQRKAKEWAAKAADELKAVVAELQASKRAMEQVQADNVALKQEVEASQAKYGQAGDGSCVLDPDSQAAARQTLIKCSKARASMFSSSGSGARSGGSVLTPTGSIPLNLLTGQPATPPLSSSGAVTLAGSPSTPSNSGWRNKSASGYANSVNGSRISGVPRAAGLSRATELLSLGGGTE
eukprot:gene12567-12699_t